MCREMISVDWQGNLYDCDFNQQLGIKLKENNLTLMGIFKERQVFEGKEISTDRHCFGCTAGTGSSCGGSLLN